MPPANASPWLELSQEREYGETCDAVPVFKESDMSASPEDLLKTQQEHLERLMSLSKVLLDSTEKVSEAQITSLRSQIQFLHDHAARLVQAKSPREWAELQAAYLRPLSDEAQAEASRTYAISRQTAEDIAGIMENQINAFNHGVNEAFGLFAQHWPQGQDSLNAAFHSLMAAGNKAYASVHQSMRQATDLAESNARALRASFQKQP